MPTTPLTLTVGSTVLVLPGGLQWTDRDWAPVVQSATVCFGGQYVVQTAAPLLAGRPITLESGANSAYLSAAQRTQLRTWAATPGQQMVLAGLRGEGNYTVIFRHQDGALSSDPVDRDNNGHAATLWRATLRFTVIA